VRTRQTTGLATVLTLTATLVVAVAGASAGNRTGGLREQPSDDRVEAFVQAVDAHGTPVGPAISIDSRTGRPDSAAPRSGPIAGAATRRSGRRSLQASGCYTAWVTRSRSGYFGETLWKYTHEKRYCWTSPRLTSIQPQAQACCVDPFWRFRGTVGANGYFFGWSGDPHGGHYSFRQGQFDQSIGGQVISSAYPWIKLWVYGNGSFRYATDIS
jgi:hypothetical protein